MKVSQSRSFFDFTRNINQSGTGTTTTVGPHGLAQRFNHTVPTGKVSYVHSAWVRLARATAAAPVGRAKVRLDFSWAVVATQATLYTNGVGDKEYAQLVNTKPMLAGQGIAMYTEDLSTGGTVEYEGFVGTYQVDA